MPVKTSTHDGSRPDAMTPNGDKEKTMGGSTKPRTPHPGDIVIYRRGRSTGIYVLSAFQHVSRLTFHTYDDAIRDAATVAARDHVDAWYTPDGQRYQSVATHRQEQQLVDAA